MEFSAVTSISAVPTPQNTSREVRKQPGLEQADVEKTETGGVNNRRVSSPGIANTPGNIKQAVSPDTDSRRAAGDAVTNATSSSSSAGAQSTLNSAELKQIETLKRRDREVKAHETAHLAAAGQYARGGISFSYTRGPDGRLYAVGGEVSIDSTPVSGDPQATLRKAQQVRAAALAPAQPSATDRAVAARAVQIATAARAEISAENTQSTQTGNAESQATQQPKTGLTTSDATTQAKQYTVVDEAETEQSSKIDTVA